MIWIWGSDIYQLVPPDWLYGVVTLPIVGKFPMYKLFIMAISLMVGVGLWLLVTKTYIGIMLRAGVDDQQMLSAMGVTVQPVFALTLAVCDRKSVVYGKSVSVRVDSGWRL